MYNGDDDCRASKSLDPICGAGAGPALPGYAAEPDVNRVERLKERMAREAQQCNPTCEAKQAEPRILTDIRQQRYRLRRQQQVLAEQLAALDFLEKAFR